MVCERSRSTFTSVMSADPADQFDERVPELVSQETGAKRPWLIAKAMALLVVWLAVGAALVVILALLVAIALSLVGGL